MFAFAGCPQTRVIVPVATFHPETADKTAEASASNAENPLAIIYESTKNIKLSYSKRANGDVSIEVTGDASGVIDSQANLAKEIGNSINEAYSSALSAKTTEAISGAAAGVVDSLAGNEHSGEMVPAK